MSTPAPRPVVRPRLYETVAQEITQWIERSGLSTGDRLPAEREFAQSLGVSRATLTQALVALEVVGAVTVRHGDGTIIADISGSQRIIEVIREHANRMPAVIEAREALETQLAGLAARRRSEEDLTRIEDSLKLMEADISSGGRGVDADEQFHEAITKAAQSPLLGEMMLEISALIRETRLESLSQTGRPKESLSGHRRIAQAIRDQDSVAAAMAMRNHINLVSNISRLNS